MATEQQVASDSPVSVATSHGHAATGTGGAVSPTYTQTVTLKKITPGGSTGSITYTNGRVTAYTAPT